MKTYQNFFLLDIICNKKFISKFNILEFLRDPQIKGAPRGYH